MIFSVPAPGNNTILTVGSDYSSSMDDYITVSINKKAVLSFYNYENKMYEIEVEVGDKIDAAGGGGGFIEIKEYRGLTDVTVNGDYISGTAQKNPYILFS